MLTFSGCEFCTVSVQVVALLYSEKREKVSRIELRNSQDPMDNSGNLCGPIMTGDNGAQELAPRGGRGGPRVDLKG